MNTLFINFFKNISINSIIPVIPTLITGVYYFINYLKLKTQYTYKRVFPSRFSLIHTSFSSFIQILAFAFLYYLIYFLAIYFFSSSSDIIISFFNSNITFFSCLFAFSALINYFYYKYKYSEILNIRKWAFLIYSFLPFFILAVASLTIFNNLCIILYSPIILIEVLCQPRIDTYICRKMDILLNNGKCYNGLSTHDVKFRWTYYTINTFYKKYNPNIIMNKLIIQTTAIASIRYYEAEQKLDYVYKILLNYFSFIFIDFEKEKSGNI